ncbi:MAG: hypothetical protein MZV70_59300 [Desulfobacterales bacterium]|nr:hypothetical protein [Desulfobacterales bacterium]
MPLLRDPARLRRCIAVTSSCGLDAFSDRDPFCFLKSLFLPEREGEDVTPGIADRPFKPARPRFSAGKVRLVVLVLLPVLNPRPVRGYEDPLKELLLFLGSR